jgi:hypothetical protein
MKRSARNRTAIISISRAAHDSIGIMRRFHLSEMRTVQSRDSLRSRFAPRTLLLMSVKPPA